MNQIGRYTALKFNFVASVVNLLIFILMTVSWNYGREHGEANQIIALAMIISSVFFVINLYLTLRLSTKQRKSHVVQ